MILSLQSISDVVTIPLVSDHLLDVVPELKVKKVIDLANDTIL